MKKFVLVFFFGVMSLGCSNTEDESSTINNDSQVSIMGADVIDQEDEPQLDSALIEDSEIIQTQKDSAREAYENDLSLEIKEIEEEKEDPLSEDCLLFLEEYANSIATFIKLLENLDASLAKPEVTENDLVEMMRALNILRLFLGERLNISEDSEEGPSETDPSYGVWVLFQIFGQMLSSIIDVLQEKI